MIVEIKPGIKSVPMCEPCLSYEIAWRIASREVYTVDTVLAPMGNGSGTCKMCGNQTDRLTFLSTTVVVDKPI